MTDLDRPFVATAEELARMVLADYPPVMTKTLAQLVLDQLPAKETPS
jgi:hypothetical protein